MIQRLKKYLAIRNHVRRLGHELVRRFGAKPHYKAGHVSQAVKRGGFSPAYVEYAHAAFCDQAEFEAFYQPGSGPADYRDLRLVIAKRYFSGNPAFDAQTIVHKFRHARPNTGDHHESGIGFDGDGHGH